MRVSDTQIKGEVRKLGMANSQIALLKRHMPSLNEEESIGGTCRLDVAASKGLTQAYVAKGDPHYNPTKICRRNLYISATPQFIPSLSGAAPISYLIWIGNSINALVFTACLLILSL